MTDLFDFTGNLTQDIDQFTSLWLLVGGLWLFFIFAGIAVATLLAYFFEVEYEDGTTNTEPILNSCLSVFMGLGIPVSVIAGIYLFGTYDLHPYLTLL